MPSVTVRIPDSLRTGGYLMDPQAVATSAKSRLAAIMARSGSNLPDPGPQSREVSTHVSMWLNKVEAERLTALAEKNFMQLSEIITALLQADAKRWAGAAAAESESSQPKARTALDDVVLALGMRPRVEQQRYYEGLQALVQPELKLPKVLFAEAGTGVGKTLAYLVLVHQFAAENKTAKLAIAVPSHALMDKLLKDWRDVQSATSPISTVSLIGQNEFVSEQALSAVLDEINADADHPARKWAEKGAPHGEESVIKHAWTMAGLIHAAPGFAHTQDVSLSSRLSDEDAGYESYKSQWGRVEHAQLLVMTHAMIANLVRMRITAQSKELKGRKDIKEKITVWKKEHAKELKKDIKVRIAEWKEKLPAERDVALYDVLNQVYADSVDVEYEKKLPDLDLLVVDEAHQLEDAFSLVLSQGFSIWGLRKDLQEFQSSAPITKTAESTQAMERVWNELRSLPQRVTDKGMTLGANEARYLIDLQTALAPVLKYKGNVGGPGRRRLRQCAQTIELARAAGARYEGSMAAVVEWSPDRRWPRLLVGRLSVSREMNYLWRAVAARSALVSGTLYEEMPQLTHEAARRSLAAPHEFCLTSSPVHGLWQFDRVTVCLAAATTAPNGRDRFIRPKRAAKDDQSEAFRQQRAGWLGDCCDYLSAAFKAAEGGMMVLGTAYTDVADLAECLKKSLPRAAVLHQSPGVTLASLRVSFLDAALRGERPILLAVGGAWTGFDLHSDEQPNALTDLAILNAPFGAINRSISRQNRMNYKGGYIELAAQTLVLVRQGLGRLVRSPETPPNRRIHWLDARIHAPEFAGLLNPVKRQLLKYRKVMNVS